MCTFPTHFVKHPIILNILKPIIVWMIENAWISIMLHTLTKCLKTFSKCLNTFSKCINAFSKCLKTFSKCLKTISKYLKTFLKCLCIKTNEIFKNSQSLSSTRRVKSKMTKSCCCSIFPSASLSWFSGLFYELWFLGSILSWSKGPHNMLWDWENVYSICV